MRGAPAAVSAVLALAAIALAAPAPAGAAAQWRYEHPSFGKETLTTLGRPGDLQFRPGSDNRVLLAIEGGSTFPKMGLFTWDGREWTALAEVCGASADNARIAWAGSSEFWTIAQPSPPRGGPSASPDPGDGLALCHFNGGEVVGSYSRARGDADPYFELEAAACASSNDCWFGGVGAEDPSGTRFGAFHLRWDGSSLSTVYAPQGRSVSDIAAFGDGYLESVRVLRDSTNNVNPAPDLAEPEPVPALLHTISGSSFANVDWFPDLDLDDDATAEVDPEATDLYALDVDGSEAWGVGGGRDGFDRGPVAVRKAGAGAWQEVPLPAGAFAANEYFADVAAIPDSEDAWVTVQPRGGDLATQKAWVVRLSPGGEIVESYTTPSYHGAAAKIDCGSATQCWLATVRGVLYHYSDSSLPLPAQDADPAFSETIVDRPNEAVSQAVPDTPPEDDSELFKPAETEVESEEDDDQKTKKCPNRPALIKVLDSDVLGVRRLTLRVEIRVRRKARVSLLAYRGKRRVASTRPRRMAPGRHTLTMPVSRKLFPKRLKFRTRELTRSRCGRKGKGS